MNASEEIYDESTHKNSTDKITYEEFRAEWLSEIEDGNPSPLEKGRRFAAKLVTQWLGVTTDDDDFVILGGSGDGGIRRRLPAAGGRRPR